MEWQRRDAELFNFSGIQKIYICIYDNNQVKMDEKVRLAREAWEDYGPILDDGKRVVAQRSVSSHIQYMKDVRAYDRSRGYFAIAKFIRILLLCIRFPFLLVSLLKDFFGGYDWEKRRMVVEWTVIFKLLIPVSLYFLIKQTGCFPKHPKFISVTIYCFMTDTFTYLLALIVLSDIQRPSANVIRSMIFLFANYLEVSVDFAIVYYLKNYNQITIENALAFGFSPDGACEGICRSAFLQYANKGIKFFFVTLAFGYFANHLHQREFIS